MKVFDVIKRIYTRKSAAISTTRQILKDKVFQMGVLLKMLKRICFCSPKFSSGYRTPFLGGGRLKFLKMVSSFGKCM